MNSYNGKAMAPFIDLDYQNFWMPSAAKVPPPSQDGRYDVYSTAGQRTLPTLEEPGHHHVPAQGLFLDVPLCIGSESSSVEHGVDVLPSKSNDSQQVGPSQCLRLDDTPPHGTGLTASSSIGQCSPIYQAEKLQEPSSEDSSSQVYSAEELSSEESSPVVVQAEAKTVHVPPTSSRRSDQSGSITAMAPTSPPKSSTIRSATPRSSIAPPMVPMLASVSSALPSPVLAQPCARRSASRSNECTSVDAPLCIPGNSVPFDEWARSSDAREDDSLLDSVVDDNIDGSDSDICVGNGVTDDTDYSPSAPRNDGEVREAICDTHEMDEDDEPPVKRRRTRRLTSRSGPSTLFKRGSDTSPPSASANLRTIDSNASTNASCSPAPSHTSLRNENLGQDFATYQEWPGSLKLTTIDGVAHFQIHFAGKLDSTVLQALLHAQPTTLTERHVSVDTGPAVGGSMGKRDTCARNNQKQYTLAEDNRIIELKDLGYTWPRIHRLFNRDHPGRTIGSLQVHYCTKLKDRKEKGSFGNPVNRGRVLSRNSVDGVATRRDRGAASG